MDNTHRKCLAALSALIGLQAVMFASLITQTPPHPPLTIPLFAMGPFLGCSISIAVAAMVLGATGSRIGIVISTLAAALALISFGPQNGSTPPSPKSGRLCCWAKSLQLPLSAVRIMVGAANAAQS